MSAPSEPSPTTTEGLSRPIDASVFSTSALNEIDACLRLLAGSHSKDSEGTFETKRLGRFEIRGVLGHGGFGVVYAAYDSRLQREVALKIPRLEILVAPEHRARFLREGRTLAALDHPGIVPVYEAGEEEGVLYIATGYCPGPTLGDWLSKRDQPMPSLQAAHWLIGITEGVQHAHSRGVLHRDLKPTNILLVPVPGARAQEFAFQPQVTDFGLAKHLAEDETITAHDGLVGTPPYLAPEQALRRPNEITVQTDVYSLGAILYEMLSGKPPFAAESPLDPLRRVVEETPAPLRTLRPDLSKDLDRICMKCLEKEPGERYASAAELAADLQRYLSGIPVLARPVGPMTRGIRWCRRRPLVATLLSALALTLLLGIAGVLWQWQRAERYASAVEESLIQAEQGLVNMAWVLQEMNAWSETTDPFQSGNREQLLTHYRRMLARPVPSQPSSAYLATMESFRARVAELAGDRDAAGEHFEATIRLWDALVRDHPENEDYRQALVLNLSSYGAHLKRCAKTDHPLSEPRDEVVLFRYLLALEPRQGNIVRDFASFLVERGKTMVRLDQARQAHHQFRLALGLARHGQVQFPEDLPFKRLVARTFFFSACSDRRVGSRDEAIQHFAEANQWLDLVMTVGETTAEDLLLRGDSSRLQASCMRSAHRTEDALTMFETARHFFVRFEDEHGGTPQVWNLLASTSDNLANLYESQGKHSHARLNAERFCEYTDKALRQGSANEGFTVNLPIVLRQLAEKDLQQGRIKEAKDRLKRACEVWAIVAPPRSGHADRRLEWSECLSLLAGLAAETDNPSSAVEYHRQAIALLDPAVSHRPEDEKLAERAEQHRDAMALLEKQSSAKSPREETSPSDSDKQGP